MTDSKLNFKAVAESALARVDTVLDRWLPGGKRQGGEYVALNPTRTDNSARSFSVNLNSGVWSDFATGDKGGDLISLVAYINGTNQGNACKELAEWLGLDTGSVETGRGGDKTRQRHQRSGPADWQPVFPVPEGALKDCPTGHPRLGKASKTWEYRDPDGGLLMKVLRFDLDKAGQRAKEYRPLVFGKDAKGKQQWTWKQPPDNRPLYGLDQLAAAPSQTVIMCEGEKAAQAAASLFPNSVAMTWPGGSKAINKTDFSPLAGRNVVYWRDYDDSGKDSIPALARALEVAGVASFKLVKVSLFRQYSPAENNGKPELLDTDEPEKAWPEKADAADALQMGWTAEHIELLRPLGLVASMPRKNKSPQNAGQQPTQGRFRNNENGLSIFDMKSDNYRSIGGPLEIVARSRNTESRGWGLLVSFSDFDGQKKEWNIPAALLATENGSEVIRGLMDRGYLLHHGRDPRQGLLEYLHGHDTAERVRLVERMGWQGDTAFMVPDRVIGSPPEPLHYYSDAPPLCKMGHSGTLEEWKDNVASYCQGNHLLTFAVCSAFAGPLLDVLGSETCGFHYCGDSSLGKTTVQKVAASVFGEFEEYKQTWRATDNALESTCAAFNDLLLVLDEFKEIQAKIAGQTVLMIGNGRGKSRATETGGIRGVAHKWRLVFLSTGEQTLEQVMRMTGERPDPGMEMRMLTIPAKVHDGREQSEMYGLFHTLKDISTGAELSNHLIQQASAYHGTAFPAFIEEVLHLARHDLLNTALKLQRQAKGAMVKEGESGGQVGRAADKFALVAAAGELATKFGITGWSKGDATKAAKYCFSAWLNLRGGSGNLEDKQTLEHVRSQLTKYGEAYFTRWEGDGARIDEHAPRTMQRWGFRKTEGTPDSYMNDITETVYYLTSDGFKDMCKPLDHLRAARLLKEMGALMTDSDGKRNTKKVRLPGGGSKPVNCYVISLPALWGSCDGENQEQVSSDDDAA